MKLILPLSVTMPRKTKDDRVWILNLNSYRNTHFQILNKAKGLYAEELAKSCIPVIYREYYPPPPYRFVYTVFPSSGRKFDLANVLPIIQSLQMIP